MTVNRIITRGMGGGQLTGMVILGFTLDTPFRIIRGGRTVAKDIYDNLLEEFTIAAKLLEINGKEILSPIINRRKYFIDESIEHKVSVKNVKIHNVEVNKTSVFAKLIKINRGSDGKN